MKVLITGGAGFIGSNLTKKLSNQGYEVFVIDKLLSQIHGDNPNNSETFRISNNFSKIIVGDVNDINVWEQLVNFNFDAIICLAAETGTGQSMYSSYSYCNSNISSIALLNDLILNKKIKTKKIILASSRAVYGEAKIKNNKPIATKETDIKEPKSVYAITKLTQEHLLFNGFNDIPVCALRFQNVYGIGQSLKNPYTGIIPIFSTAMKNQRDVEIFSDGLMTRDFIYVDDVVDSIILILKNNSIYRDVFNVGSGKPTTVLKVAETLKNKLNSNVNINITGENMRGDIRHNFADISKIKKLGFNPNISFDDGIELFVNWINSKNHLEYNDYENVINGFREKQILKK